VDGCTYQKLDLPANLHTPTRPCHFAGLGLLIGVALALFSGKWLTVFLVGVNPYDGLMLAATTGILTAVILAAAYGRARRAARVEPVTALRAD
jgi:ABC-type antimicrobial peptide transport system permease subunit